MSSRRLLWAVSESHKHFSFESFLGFVMSLFLRLLIKYSPKTLSRWNKICFHLWGEPHKGLLASVFLNPAPAPPHNGPDSQWADFVNESDVQKSPELSPLLSLPPPTQVIPCNVLKCQSCPSPTTGEGCVLLSAGKEGGQPGKVVYRWERSNFRKKKKKICQPRESTVLLVEIHTAMSWSLNGRK